jgi:hypothetical protein
MLFDQHICEESDNKHLVLTNHHFSNSRRNYLNCCIKRGWIKCGYIFIKDIVSFQISAVTKGLVQWTFGDGDAQASFRFWAIH